jgi:hypothetical protein
MDINELQNTVQSLSDGDIAALEGTIRQTRAARVVARNEALPEFPWLVATRGHGIPTQVPKAQAIELLQAGTHTVYSPDAA